MYSSINDNHDTYKRRGLRKRLIKTLEEKGIKDKSVLSAIGSLPRHLFVSKYSDEQIYSDKALKINSGQTISQPYTVAYQTELLNVKPGDKIMEIGTGSGYQAAVLLELGADVYTVERQKDLYDGARKLLIYLGYKNRVYFYHGDGSRGIEDKAPFQKIIVTAGAPAVPDALLKQLDIGGIMVIPVGNHEEQKMITILRTSSKDYEKIILDNFRFVPLIGEGAW